MSKLIRIALVAEGVTDYEVLHAIIEVLLGGRPFDLKLLQPEGSIAFSGRGNAGPLGGGWRGVYRWCRQAARRSDGSFRNDPIFLSYDLVLLHLDADVAAEDPGNSRSEPHPELAGVLPCNLPCPPANATTDLLRAIMLSWVGETQVPAGTVLCTPSKSTEAWVMAALFPDDREMKRQGWECHPNPESRLSQQPVRVRIAKTHAHYVARRAELQAGWPRVESRLTEARRFRRDFDAASQELEA